MPEPIANLKKENNYLNTQVLCIILVSLLNRFLLKMLGFMVFFLFISIVVCVLSSLLFSHLLCSSVGYLQTRKLCTSHLKMSFNKICCWYVVSLLKGESEGEGENKEWGREETLFLSNLTWARTFCALQIPDFEKNNLFSSLSIVLLLKSSSLVFVFSLIDLIV